MELAEQSEADRPLDAARAYARDVEAQIDHKKTKFIRLLDEAGLR